LTNATDQNIIQSGLWKQGAGGRHQIGTVAGFVLECMADIVGTRTYDTALWLAHLMHSLISANAWCMLLVSVGCRRQNRRYATWQHRRQAITSKIRARPLLS
jgi:hypothetical protein